MAAASKRPNKRTETKSAATARTSALLLDEIAAAAELLVSPRTLQRWRVEGRGPAYIKLGKLVRYTRESLARCVAAGERQSTSQPAA